MKKFSDYIVKAYDDHLKEADGILKGRLKVMKSVDEEMLWMGQRLHAYRRRGH